MKLSEKKTNKNDAIISLGIGSNGKEIKINLSNSSSTLILGNNGSGKTLITKKIIEQLVTENESIEVYTSGLHNENLLESDLIHQVSYLNERGNDTYVSLEKMLTLFQETVEKRYKLMPEEKVINFSKLQSKPPRIVFVINNFDLLIKEFISYRDAPSIQNQIAHLNRIGRSAGFHIILTLSNIENLHDFAKDSFTNIIILGEYDNLTETPLNHGFLEIFEDRFTLIKDNDAIIRTLDVESNK